MGLNFLARRPSPAWIGSASVLAVVLLIPPRDRAGFSGGGRGDSSPETATASDRRPPAEPDGRALYLKHCAPCHGERGFGDGEAAYLLFPRPRDLGAYHFRLVSTDNLVPTDQDLFDVVTRGMLGSAMPPHAHLPEADRHAIVKEVRRLMTEEAAKRLVDESAASGQPLEEREAREIAFRAPGRVLVPPPDPPATPEILARGRMIYVRHCAGCHDLDGTGRSRSDMVDSLDRPLFARDFTAGILKGGTEPADIYRRIRCGMGGTPMPANPLSDDDSWAIVHFVRSLIRPGAQERLQQRKTGLAAQRVVGPLGSDPAAPVWNGVSPTWLPMAPLWWREPRVDGVLVQFAHDGTNLAVRLVWEDASEDTFQNDQRSFSDACAVQWHKGDDPPFFAMGQAGHVVDIWYWRAAFQADAGGKRDVETLTEGVVNDMDFSLLDPPFGSHASRGDFRLDAHKKLYITGWGAGNPLSDPDRTCPVDNLHAAGFGTLTARTPGPAAVEGRGRWERGFWEVVMLRPLAGGGDLVAFEPGTEVCVGFAAWNGRAGDRDGEKNVTIWHCLHVEK